MNCPLFIDYIRECTNHVGNIPQDTFEFCTSERYKGCPFYQVLQNPDVACIYIKQCVLFKYFGALNFDALVKLTERYCLTLQANTCQRYLLRESGKNVPENLLPDGTTMQSDEHKKEV